MLNISNMFLQSSLFHCRGEHQYPAMTPEPDQSGEVNTRMLRTDEEEEEEESSPAPPAVMERFGPHLGLSGPQVRYEQSCQYLTDLQETPDSLTAMHGMALYLFCHKNIIFPILSPKPLNRKNMH